MNLYEVYDKESDILLARGTARECQKKLGCASIDSFYALANRSVRGINKAYRVVITKGGDADYPVLGEKDPARLGKAKPIKHGYKPGMVCTVSYTCPRCGSHVSRQSKCVNCGQELDWDE